MKVFRGDKKEEKTKMKLADNAKLTRNRLTNIPERVMDIETYPTALKKGTIHVTEENAEPTFKEFLKEHKGTFKVEPDDLKIASVKKIKNKWYIKYSQYYKGIPVHNASVGIDSSANGKVSSYASNYQPNIDIATEPKVSLNQAVEIAKLTYPGNSRQNLKEKNTILTIYTEKSRVKITHHLAWKFLMVGEQPDPEIEKYFIIDALDGKIIHSYTARPDANVTGNVQVEIYPENPTDFVTTMALRNQYVEIEDAGRATTNRSGNYTKNVPSGWGSSKQATFTLDGPYAHVEDLNGAEYTENRNCNTSTPCNLTWTAADRDHLNLFYHMNLFHDWLEDELGYSWVNLWDGTSRFNARVNDPRNNAWAGDPMLFGTNNYARSSDVIYHECTHNVLAHLYGDYIGWPANYTEGYAMDEGFADHFGNAFTNDPVHGEGCSASPRDHDNNDKYQGKTGFNKEGHTGGMTIGGAAWDFRQRLISAQGASGATIADKLILEAHQILSTYPRDYYFSDPHESNLLTALYKAADDNTNLQDKRVPYFKDIQITFHNHDLLQAILEDGDSFDFSANMVGNFTGGDLYYYDGKFWANNVNQQGVIDLGNIGDVDLSEVDIPNSGYTRFGVNAVAGHTYMSHAQKGEPGGNIAFRVAAISADKSTVTIKYFYQINPYRYVANLNSKEIHKSNCYWVSRMANRNKSHYSDLWELAVLIIENGYNGCHYCLPRYDEDTLSTEQVRTNLNNDID
jgi:Zn-dependent metalloprotease